MKLSYNLIDEKWIPCLKPNAEPELLGLRDALTNATQISEILGESPPVTIALHRLLLAILHRALDAPKDYADWKRIWDAGNFETDKIFAYLEKYRSAFDLFDDEKPFFQTAAVGFERVKSVEKLFFQNTDTSWHFGDKRGAEVISLSPPEAARCLTAMQACDVGGLISAEDGKESANSALLLQTAVALMRGENLFETLMLNFHRYEGEYDAPFTFKNETDFPAWERTDLTQPAERLPVGYADLLTWQSRRLRLQPEISADGSAIVRNFVQMKGFQLFKNTEPKDYETMVAFRNKPDAKANERAWFAVRFNVDKALWRDSLALFQKVKPDDSNKQKGKVRQTVRPKIFDWLGDLAAEGFLKKTTTLQVDFLGVTADQANYKIWRHERLLLPLAYLGDDKISQRLFIELGKALSLAEDVAFILKRGSQELATLLLAEHADHKAGRQPDKKNDVNPLAASFGIEDFYWSRLETPFKTLMLALPNDVREEIDEGETQTFYGEKELPHWRKTLREMAEAALLNTTRSLDASARNLKAAARAERLLYALLRETLSENKPEEKR